MKNYKTFKLNDFILMLSFIIMGISSCAKHDITNAVLTETSPLCKDYVGSYFANVKDVNNHVNFEANFSIEHKGNKYIWQTDALPNHDFNDNTVANFPNKVREQAFKFEMTDDPKFASSKTPLSLTYYNAILLNGALVDLLSDGCCCLTLNAPGCGDGIIGCNDMSNPWRKDPVSPKAGFMPDSHNAHAQEDGTYHYHGNPQALYDRSGSKVSPVIGFAADGFPIHGPFINDNGTIRKVKSSYKLIPGTRPVGSCPNLRGEINYDGTYIQDYQYRPGSGDLDECNGMIVDGQYGYYLTEEYPYMIKFFKGTPDPSFQKHMH